MKGGRKAWAVDADVTGIAFVTRVPEISDEGSKMPAENGEEVCQYSHRKQESSSSNNQVYAKEVVVHELSSKPTDFWKRWTKTAKVMRLQVAFWSSFFKIRRFI